MHPALWTLLRMDFAGSFRSLTNLRENWRQLILLMLMLVFVGFFIYVRVQNPDSYGASRFGPAMPFWSLLYLMATWLTASADRGLVMRPAEIHFVAGGPFHERDIITLNLVRLAFRSFISALVLSLLAMAYVPSYLSALVGIWMLIGVSLLVGMVASLSSRSAHGATVKRIRRVFNLLAMLTLIGLIAQSFQHVKAAGAPPGVAAIAGSAVETQIGAIVLPPLDWMFRPMASASFFPDTVYLLPARLGVIGLLVGAVYLLGGRYLEASTRRTDQSVEKRNSALRSGVAGPAGSRSWTAGISLPAFPRLGGVGSVAWMQMQHSVRILPRFLMFTVTIVGVVLVIPMMVDARRLIGASSIAWMTGLTLYADFLLLLQLPVGFLGPVSQREMLKSLPIPTWRSALGLLAGPVIPLSVIHLVVFVLFLFLAPQDRALVLLTAVALIPGAWVLIANVNLLGSWNIIRPRALQQRDALAAGRAMASVWIFFLTLSPAIICGSVFSILLGVLFDAAMPAFILGASLGVAISSTLYIWLIARSFKNWQPSPSEGGKEEEELDQ
ncbi:MAG: hypothetical protein AAF394_01575 [Planctomycetota bacterium]